MRRKYYRYKASHRTVRGIKQKRCTICEKWKPESDFHKDRARTDGLKIRCKDCERDYYREQKRKKGRSTREYLRLEQRHRVVRGVRQKLCGRCKQWKDESSFRRNPRLRDGLGSYCMKCTSEYAHERYEEAKKGEGKTLQYEERHRIVNGVRMKLCSKCGKWKKESYFYKDGRAKDGRTGRCRRCSYTVTSRSKLLEQEEDPD